MEIIIIIIIIIIKLIRRITLSTGNSKTKYFQSHKRIIQKYSKKILKHANIGGL